MADINLKKAADTIDKRYDEDKDRRKDWERWRGYYESDYWNDDLDEQYSRVDCGKLFSTVSQLAPLMTDSRPEWSVIARNPGLQPIVEEFNKALTFLWDELDMGSKVAQAFQDALLMEQGCLQIDYDDEAREVRVDVVDPRHLVFQDGGHSNLEDCAWVCKRRTYTLGDLQRRYPKAAGKLVADAKDKEPDGARLGARYGDVFDSTNRWVTVYELWMRDPTVEDELAKDTEMGREAPAVPKAKRAKYPNGRFIVFTRTSRDEGRPLKLADYPSPFGHGKPPWVLIYDYRLTHQVWGLGEARGLMPLVNELNDVLQSIAFKVRNSCRGNWLADPKQLDVGEFRKNQSRGAQVFEINDQSRNPAAPGATRTPPVEPVAQLPPLQQEFQYVQILERMIEEKTSVTDIIRGQENRRQERRTGQEFQGLLEAGHTRTRLRVRMLDESIAKVLHVILTIMMEFYDEPRHFSMEDPDGGLTYGQISNRVADAERVTRQGVRDEFRRQEEAEVEVPQVDGEEDPALAEQVAVDKLIAALPVGADKVSARFKVVIRSQSSLPTDVQSRANTILQLFRDGAVDRVALLKQYLPGMWQEINDRMMEAEQAQAAAQQPQQPQPVPITGGEGDGEGYDAAAAEAAAGAQLAAVR